MIQAGTSSQSQAMPVVRLSQNSVLRLIVQVPESAVARIHVGEAVEVKVQAVNRTFQGKVARFAERLNLDTRTMETEVDVPNPALDLVPGMYASASITAEQAHGVLVVPIQAVEKTEDNVDAEIVQNLARLRQGRERVAKARMEREAAIARGETPADY